MYVAAAVIQKLEVKKVVTICYCFDGVLFNLQRLKAQRKTSISVICKLQSADDNATPALAPPDLQDITDAFVQVYEFFGLTVGIKKMKALA